MLSVLQQPFPVIHYTWQNTTLALLYTLLYVNLFDKKKYQYSFNKHLLHILCTILDRDIRH